MFLERARFLVESESRPGKEPPYLVDLLEYRRNGWCCCKDFAVRIQPIWEAGQVPAYKRCKHIVACRRYLARRIASECRHKANRVLTDRDGEKAVKSLLGQLWRKEGHSQRHPIRVACRTRESVNYPRRIAPKSQKRIKEDEEYFRLVVQFKLEHPYCEVCPIRDRTPRPTQNPHHRRGRSGNLRMAVETWTSSCRDCHNFIENNKAWAKEHGLIEKWGKQV